MRLFFRLFQDGVKDGTAGEPREEVKYKQSGDRDSNGRG